MKQNIQEDYSDVKCMYGLFDLAKSILNCGAYEFENVLLYKQHLSEDDLDRIASARFDLKEAYDKIESVIKSKISK